MKITQSRENVWRAASDGISRMLMDGNGIQTNNTVTRRGSKCFKMHCIPHIKSTSVAIVY